MMRAASRQHLTLAVVISMLLLLFLLVGSELTMQARNLVVRFRANTASVWMALGQEDAIWPLMKHEADPTLRTRLIHRLSPLVVDASEILPALNKQDDVSTRRAMLLLAGELAKDSYDQSGDAITREGVSPTFIQALLSLYKEDPDRGMHAAAEWTLLRYGQASEAGRTLRAMKAEAIQGDRQWYVTSELHTMVIVPGPAEFMMGTPVGGSFDAEDEAVHSQQIRRSFSIASKETTIAQFERFLLENRTHQYSKIQQPNWTPDCPQTNVSWYDAVAYCNWLSNKAGIPKEQWCYVANGDGEYASRMTVADDIFVRTGYRLPTEAEWEYACRAGTTTDFNFGRDESQLAAYAVMYGPETTTAIDVGAKKPNDYGLFDMHGNVSEWCHDRYRLTPMATMIDSFAPIPGIESRVVRGGSFEDGPARVRSAARGRSLPGDRNATLGFRVARSYP